MCYLDGGDLRQDYPQRLLDTRPGRFTSIAAGTVTSTRALRPASISRATGTSARVSTALSSTAARTSVGPTPRSPAVPADSPTTGVRASPSSPTRRERSSAASTAKGSTRVRHRRTSTASPTGPTRLPSGLSTSPPISIPTRPPAASRSTPRRLIPHSAVARAAPSTTANPSFTFTSADPGASFACSLDGAGVAPCSSPQAYSGVSDGAHTFRVEAVDAATNVDPTPASAGFTVDTAPPRTTLEPGPKRIRKGKNARFRFSSSEPGSSFECRLVGERFAPCASPMKLIKPRKGRHIFEARATDVAANVDPTPAESDVQGQDEASVAGSGLTCHGLRHTMGRPVIAPAP